MIYAIFFQETEEDDENGECTIGNAAFDALNVALGSTGHVGGQDNGWSCCAVDSEDKIPALKKALPGHEVVEMTPANLRKWTMLFGEFGPEEGGVEEWYRLCSSG